jgi:hypothetical protein
MGEAAVALVAGAYQHKNHLKLTALGKGWATLHHYNQCQLWTGDAAPAAVALVSCISLPLLFVFAPAPLPPTSSKIN